MALIIAGAGSARGALGQGSELEIGGLGDGQGKFRELRDITFDSQNRLFVLCGARMQKGKKGEKDQFVGSQQVQWFDNNGKYLGEFPVRDESLGERNNPMRLAVDGQGNVYVTQPTGGFVQRFSPEGKLLGKLDIKGAFAITSRKVAGAEQIVVAPNLPDKKKFVLVDQLPVIKPNGEMGEPVRLSQPVGDCQDITADAAGNLYLLGAVNQIYKFDAAGKLLATLGGGTKERRGDGSELLHTVAVDSKGAVYSMTWGNPGSVTRFSPDLKTVEQRLGQFKFADAWGRNGEYTPLAVDRNDRLWVGAIGEVPTDAKQHFRPAVMRLDANFLAPQFATSRSTKLLGLTLAVESNLPYGVSCELAPTTVELVVKAGTRQVQNLDVTWVVHDLWKNEIARGQFPLPLKQGEESRHAVGFTPPKWGWYTVSFHCAEDGEPLMAAGGHVGFAPKYAGMPEMTQDASKGGWIDPVRQAFCGLPLLRVNTGQIMARDFDLEGLLRNVQQFKLTLLVQFESQKECAPEHVREVLGRLKGKVKYYEVVNEPNFTMSPEQYVATLKEVYAIIKQIDPQAQVMGPAVCGIILDWYEAFYKNGGKDFTDILSMHDYEGNEAVDPYHWSWKVGELRKIMAKYGDEKKPVWQTERAIGAVRMTSFMPGVQAVRVLLQRDVLETLGISAEHNLHYYVNEGGYTKVPTYLWSRNGPFPAALATRTRQAMIAGRQFAGQLDFGPTGNKVFMGPRYDGEDGTTITLRNLGTLDRAVELGVSGEGPLQLVDVFGNVQTVAAQAGKIKVITSPLPVYLRLAKGQTLTPLKIDFGRNLASAASFVYSAPSQGDPAILTNGIYEGIHTGNPNGTAWAGELQNGPQTLEVSFPHPRTVERLLVHSVRADNPHCALLDYDLQYHDGKNWVTLQEVRTPCPSSDLVINGPTRANSWYLDQNFFVHEFPPVTTAKLRLVARRSTWGFMADEIAAVQAAKRPANQPHLTLREIEIYGPPTSVTTTLTTDAVKKTQAFERAAVQLVVSNGSVSALDAKATMRLPEGWRAEPAEISISSPAGQSSTISFTVIPPAVIAAGSAPVDVTVTDPAGKVIDFERLTLQVVPPVRLTPKVPAEFGPKDGKQEMVVEVRNLTDQPVSGTLQVEVTPSDGAARQGAQTKAGFGPIEPRKAAPVTVALEAVPASTSGYRLRCSATVNGIVVVQEVTSPAGK